MKKLSFLLAILLGIMFSTLACAPVPQPLFSTIPPQAATTVPGPAATPTASAIGLGYLAAYGFGRDATQDEIKAWDIDVMPSGTGFPPGSGTVAQGAQIYATKCAYCHGDKGQGGLPQSVEVLVGTKPWFEKGKPRFRPPRTIGNWWPYATTIFDYVRRSMPFDRPGSLTDDEVYAVAAWLLNQNQIIGENEVMNAQTLPKVKMPALDYFFIDPGPFQVPEPR